MTPERWKSITDHYQMAKDEGASLHHSMVGDCIKEIERLQQELSLEKANAEMRRKEILLGVKEIVRWRTEAERLLVKRPTNNCDCGNPINHDYCTRCLRQWES
ncbi:hypothetical protein LCGC14_3022350 [marine sediment metagenome]|uniref:Uncharacterized protein n=1 Tax=marine sediment metagenome TaxID=412755 RepID=A0A0F8XHY1_9ZZZZ